MSSTIQSEKYNIHTTIVRGIVCKKCGVTLPDMLMSEHLDITNPKNKMCGCIKSESAKKIDPNSSPMPERQNNIQSVTMNTTTITKSKKVCVCSACGKEGHRKTNEKFHPIVPKEEKVDPYMEELIKCVKCETDIKRKDMKFTNGGGLYTDVCQKCYDEKHLIGKMEIAALLEKRGQELIKCIRCETDTKRKDMRCDYKVCKTCDDKKQLIRKMEKDALLEKHRLEDLQDEQDLINIKSSAPVFLPRKHRGECGLENGEIHFPLLRMGCSEDAKGIVTTITIPLRPIIDKAFFEDFAKIMRRYPMFDWSAMSFMRNIIHPNREHIKRTMNLDDQLLERVMEDAYVVINQWYNYIGEETYDKLGNLEYVPANHTTFFTSRHCDY